PRGQFSGANIDDDGARLFGRIPGNLLRLCLGLCSTGSANSGPNPLLNAHSTRQPSGRTALGQCLASDALATGLLWIEQGLRRCAAQEIEDSRFSIEAEVCIADDVLR